MNEKNKQYLEKEDAPFDKEEKGTQPFDNKRVESLNLIDLTEVLGLNQGHFNTPAKKASGTRYHNVL